MHDVKPEDINKLGYHLIDDINNTVLKPPIVLTFEKAIYRILLIKKKKYAYILYDEKGKPVLEKSALVVKGILTARRDNCLFARQTYSDILWECMLKSPVYYILNMLFTQIKKLLAGDVPPEQLLVVQKMGAVYKQANNKMKNIRR